MKIRTMTMAAVMAAVPGTCFARNIEVAGTAEITVCTEGTVNDVLLIQAKGIASTMFTAVGVTVHWHGMNHCPVDAIRISLSERTAANNRPGALAYALPYEGTHIVLFWDRIQDLSSGRARPHLLAHVLVHEVTHILQGVDRHSETGIMKAHYTLLDVAQMECHPLTFTDLDVLLIQLGIRDRQAHSAAAERSESE
jgi:hypothetical protein